MFTYDITVGRRFDYVGGLDKIIYYVCKIRT
jgi:hypothetical protein